MKEEKYRNGKIITEEKKSDIKIFGFRINNTIGVILFYLVFSWVISYIRLTYTFITFFTQLADLLGLGLSFALATSLINFFFYMAILLVYIYILLVCVKLKKTYEEDEVIESRWFGFRLNQISSVVLGILSILNIILGIFSVYGYIGNLIQLSLIFSFPAPSIYTIQFILNFIDGLILLLLNIYTFIICKRNY
ncbi:hypothetical protein LCGC14_0786540 [marine sediment metagenome]|uniref:Uncharacterized protein n=1 Tax=marine sediment metagenome TaxID=412755 RepID=A0A0F9PU15_9ZZZZ|nr:MAG: hypothetical protein Lokiarch_52840 [Candidatus Lokiarchaeum sp. GC14_75]